MRRWTLAAVRKNLNLTQDQMAERLGVSRKTISAWENGKTIMRRANILAFCQATGYDKDELYLP